MQSDLDESVNLDAVVLVAHKGQVLLVLQDATPSVSKEGLTESNCS